MCIIRLNSSQSKLPKIYEEDTVAQLKQRWDTEMGLCFLTCTDVTKVGYQSALNLLSKERVLEEDHTDEVDPDRCRWVHWKFKHGTPMPTICPKDQAFNRAQEVHAEYGLKSIEGGKGFTTDVKYGLERRVEYITSKGFEEPPTAITMITGPDACNWNDNPQDKDAKHLTSWVISPNLSRPLRALPASQTSAKRTESANRMHSSLNNIIAVAYEGDDKYDNLRKYMGPATTPSPGSCCSTALSQILALRDGGLDYNFNGEQVHATIKLKGTADMKAVLEILALQPAGSSHPCDQCECNKDYLHQSKEYLRSNGLMQPRTYKRLCMSGHLWGEEADLTEPYDCPFCHQHITGPGQFPAPGNSEHEKFPLQHAGKYPGKLPVVPMEPKDIIPDCLHGTLLRVAPRVHQVTHTKFLHSKAEAEAIGAVYQGAAKVSNYTPYFRDKKKAPVIECQSWNGHECWGSVASWADTLYAVHCDATGHASSKDSCPEKYKQCQDLYKAYTDLLAAVFLDIKDDRQFLWPYLADEIERAGEVFRKAMILAGDEFDITVSMHKVSPNQAFPGAIYMAFYYILPSYTLHIVSYQVICHYGDVVRDVENGGPIVRYICQRIEAQHQVVKRARSRHSNYHNAGATRTNENSTCVMQVGGKVVCNNYVEQQHGPFVGKRGRKNVFTGYEPLAELMDSKHTELLEKFEAAHQAAAEAAAEAELRRWVEAPFRAAPPFP